MPCPIQDWAKNHWHGKFGRGNSIAVFERQDFHSTIQMYVVVFHLSPPCADGPYIVCKTPHSRPLPWIYFVYPIFPHCTGVNAFQYHPKAAICSLETALNTAYLPDRTLSFQTTLISLVGDLSHALHHLKVIQNILLVGTNPTRPKSPQQWPK